MIDREKVLEGIKCHVTEKCCDCPYREGWKTCDAKMLWNDIYALLKEQKPIQVAGVYDNGDWDCGYCGYENINTNIFCGHCGHLKKI